MNDPTNLPALNHATVQEARARCESAHAGQTRFGGEPNATHPHAVACILAERGHDDPTLLATAYLHDVLEDTDVPRCDLVDEFGEEVVGLVDELTNIGPADRTFDEKHESLRQEALKMSPRAKLVKLADRLHNLNQMDVWPEWKRDRYRRVTNDLLKALEPVPDEFLAADVRRAAGLASGS